MMKNYFSKTILSQSRKKFQFLNFQLRNFRDPSDTNFFNPSDNRNYAGEYKSPYVPQFNLSEEERVENDKLPVEQRVLDWSKYMKHKGKLKYTTGVYLVDVEPFPRLKIMMLCDIAMNTLKKIPDSYEYKHMSFNYIKYIMKVVDENESIIDIETKISNITSAEDIIVMLHNEVTLLQTIVREKIYDQVEEAKKKIDFKEFFFWSAAFRERGHPTFGPIENLKHRKNERPERPATAHFDEKNKH